MKKVAFIILILALSNCDSNEKSFFFRIVDKGNVKLMPIEIEKHEMGNGSFSFVYTDQNHDTTRFALSSTESGLSYLIRKGDTTNLLLKDRRSYTIANKEHEVYKVYGNEDEADGLLVYFWSRDFGVLLSSVPNWRESKFLGCDQKSDDCETIRTLQQLIVADFFSIEEPKSQIDFVEPKVED